MMRQEQYMIGRTVSCEGVGLHTGAQCRMALVPAPFYSGIHFFYRHKNESTVFPARIEHLRDTEFCTTLCSGDYSLKTVEHLLAALSGLEIDNVCVEVDCDEIPILDGSAEPFVELIRSAGIQSGGYSIPRSFIKITEPISIIEDDQDITILPSATPRISYTIDYSHPCIGRQTYDYELNPDTFVRDLAPARTFGFLNDISALYQLGLAQGGSMQNAVVLSDTRVLTPGGLRFPDEFVRHKIVDLLGDMTLLGAPFLGHIIANRAGHNLHTRLVKKILASPDCWELAVAEYSNNRTAEYTNNRTRQE